VIEIRSEACEEWWRFTVADNGEGIPREYHRAVFEPLKRLHGNDTPGTGLGLAICRSIVVRHGGKIWLESEGAGHDASFHFTLSRTAEQAQVIGRSGTGHGVSEAGLA
jgi:signal transduction histidine kinase